MLMATRLTAVKCARHINIPAIFSIMIERKSAMLEEVFAQQNLEFEEKYRENNFMVIAKDDVLSVDDVDIIKQIRENNKLVILNKEPTYSDYRGEEYTLATYLVSEIALPVLVGCFIGWITAKMQSYRARAADNQKMPKVSVDVFRTEKFKMVSIKAEELEDALKILKGLRDKDDAG